MFCNGCGNLNALDRCCPKCGRQVPAQVVRPKRRTILVVTGLIIGFILVMYILGDRSDHESEAKPVAQPAPVTQPSLNKAQQRRHDDELINSEAAGPVREQYAETVENQMLQQGYDMTVRAVGARRQILRFQWVRMSRPVIYGFINNKQVVNTLKAMGFKTLVFTVDLTVLGNMRSASCDTQTTGNYWLSSLS
jgi:hypothetical protein